MADYKLGKVAEARAALRTALLSGDEPELCKEASALVGLASTLPVNR